MRSSRIVYGVVDKIKEAGKNFVKGNIVNPKATDPLLPENFRFPSPSSQPEFHFDQNFPTKTHDIASIYYFPRSHRRFIEPQVVTFTVDAKGQTAATESKSVGTVDAPFTPVAQAKDSEQILKIDLLAEMKTEIEANDWTKQGVRIPPMGKKVHVYTEVDASEWNRNQ